MYVAETGLYYVPKLTIFPSKFKPRVFNLKPMSTLFPPKSKSKRSSLVCRAGRAMDGAREDEDEVGSEQNSALEQEERSRFFGGFSPARNGLQFTLNRLSKWLVAGLFAATIVGRHDAEAVWAAMGSVVNTALSVVLKRILNQQRPNSAISSGPGMPSSHAQSISYVVLFVIWSLIEWLGVNGLSLALGALALALGSYMSWLRVSQEYHTSRQVAVGALVGLGFAFIWLWFWQAFVLRAFVSALWVRVVVVVASVLCCFGFLVHAIRRWLREEE